MWDFDVGALPVVDDAGRLVGIITDRDICLAGVTHGRASSERVVSVVMAREVLSCAPDEPMGVLVDKMRRHQVRRLPIMDGGRLVGIVSLIDLALAAARGDVGLSFEEVCRTLAAIGENRAGRGAR
jgi:CBS domain-containing protein